jgi:Fe-S cluster biogenesis protein NfuA
MQFHSLKLKKLGLVLALPLICGAAFASGVDSVGGGLSGQQQMYNAGKAVYTQKLACSACMMAGKTLDKALAQTLLNDAAKTSNLSDDERSALATYLKLRFKL